MLAILPPVGAALRATSASGRGAKLRVEAVHRHKRTTASHKRRNKKRDIRTSFVRTTAAPDLTPPPPVPAAPANPSYDAATPGEPQLQQEQEQQQPEALPGVLLLEGSAGIATVPPSEWLLGAAGGQPAGAGGGNANEEGLQQLAVGEASSTLATMADLDRLLDGLIISPHTLGPSSPSSSGSSSPGGSGAPAAASSKGRAGSAGARGEGARAPAGPAVVDLLCASDWQRELAAAAAHGQLLVVKVEGSRPLLRGASDAALRFQTHTGLPTALNAYGLHAGGSLGAGGFGGGSPAGSPAGSLGSYEEALPPVAGGGGPVLSPVHSWFHQLAARYAGGCGDAPAPLRFLSLQSDSPRGKALCRQLGVPGSLVVLLVDGATGRKLLEVRGTKIEAELPPGLLYFGDMDPEGARPSELLPRLSSRGELDAHRSSSEVAVVAWHMRGAPPCVASYGDLYGAARELAAAGVRCAVMDVDGDGEGAELGAELGLQRLPAYVVYRGGSEATRLEGPLAGERLREALQQAALGDGARAGEA